MDISTEPRRASAVHFLRRRDAWIRWVLESDLQLTSRVVGVHLAMRMNVTDQVAWPNIETIAKLLGRSPRQISRALYELDEFGALLIVRDRGRGNRYLLRLPTDA